LILASLIACERKPPPAGPEQAFLSTLGQALAQSQEKAVALYDLEIRQRADLFEEIKQAAGGERLKILEAAKPRLADPAALDTLRLEVQGEMMRGKAWGVLDKSDFGRNEIPEPKPEMGQQIGLFLFELRKQVGYITSGRVRCGDGSTAFFQLVKRKGEGKPLALLRIAL
jgi:hypothetical protein